MEQDKDNSGNEPRYDFYKNNQGDVIFWRDNVDKVGEFEFSFDKKT